MEDNLLKTIKLVKDETTEKEQGIPINKDSVVSSADIRFDENVVPFTSKIYAHDGMTIDELMGKERPNDDQAYVIIQDGGVGDAICATPMIESAKKQFPDKKIIVGSSHHEVLINNPHIDKLYNLGFPQDLFETWVKPLKHFGSVVKRDIYNASAHKLFPGTLSCIWCHLYGVPFTGDDVKIYLTDDEDSEAKHFLKSSSFISTPIGFRQF